MNEIISGRPELRRLCEKAKERMVGLAVNEAAGMTEDDPPWLWKLKIKGQSALNEPEVERSFLEAAKGSPGNKLFQQASDALSKPLDDTAIKERISHQVKNLMLKCWLAEDHAPLHKSFCHYSDPALKRLVAFLLDLNEIDENTIRKIWERLGLRKSKHLLIRDVIIKKNPRPNEPGAIPVYFKKFVQRKH